MNDTILLDMDGVIADFVTAAAVALNMPCDPTKVQGWDLPKHFGIDAAAFWAAQDAIPDFWLQIKPYPNIGLFIDTLRTYGEVYFLTAPSLHRNCASHKIAWLRQHVGDWTTGRFLIGKPKHLLAKPYGTVLIDDSDANCDAWGQAGGQYVTFPRSWNGAGAKESESAAQIHTLEAVRAWSKP